MINAEEKRVFSYAFLFLRHALGSRWQDCQARQSLPVRTDFISLTLLSFEGEAYFFSLQSWTFVCLIDDPVTGDTSRGMSSQKNATLQQNTEPLNLYLSNLETILPAWFNYEKINSKTFLVWPLPPCMAVPGLALKKLLIESGMCHFHTNSLAKTRTTPKFKIAEEQGIPKYLERQ